MRRLPCRMLPNSIIVLAVLLCSISLLVTGCGEATDCDTVVQERLMEELTNWWAESDGFCFHYIVPRLFEMSLSNPNVFYGQMSRDTTGYQRFLESLSPTVFTNLTDTVTWHLEQRRLDAIKKLESQEIDSRYASLYEELLETLRGIDVRYVD